MRRGRWPAGLAWGLAGLAVLGLAAGARLAGLVAAADLGGQDLGPVALAVVLDDLRGELLGVVEQTMQPTRASLWLRPPTV